MEKDNIRHSLLSSYRMRLLASGDEEYIIIPLSSCAYVFNHNGLERMRKVLEQSDAPFIYSDYIEQGELVDSYHGRKDHYAMTLILGKLYWLNQWK